MPAAAQAPPSGGVAPGGRAHPAVVNAVLLTVTAVAIALRAYPLTRPGYLLGVTQYDDGALFGSAVMLVHGYLPYRDFILVQPPGITLLMAPVAALTQGLGTAWGLGVGRILTAAAGGAAAGLGGLLVRHRGLLAVLITSGVIAVYPAGVRSARTVLLEPWLVLFCLLGALAVFEGDRLAHSRRLAWGGAAFGFAGAVKVWAVVPVVVVLVLILAARRMRGARCFAAGSAVGFLVPVLPFAALAPRTFYRSVVLAQLLRTDRVPTPLTFRLRQLTGLTHVPRVGPVPITVVALALLALVAGSCVAAWWRTGHGPPLLERFAYATSLLTVLAFLWPADFYYHYAGFLAPFLAMSIALPVARLVDPPDPAAGRAARAPSRGLSTAVMLAAGAALVAMAVVQGGSESLLRSSLTGSASGRSGDVVARARRVIPAGACLLTDKASYAIAADRLVSSEPGCVPIVDGVGTDYALSRGRTTTNGAQQVPAVRALWLGALRHADYVWLSPRSSRRIPWTVRSLSAYFDRHFEAVPGGPSGLYVRISSGAGAGQAGGSRRQGLRRRLPPAPAPGPSSPTRAPR